jgi:hypothetical protein
MFPSFGVFTRNPRPNIPKSDNCAALRAPASAAAKAVPKTAFAVTRQFLEQLAAYLLALVPFGAYLFPYDFHRLLLSC